MVFTAVSQSELSLAAQSMLEVNVNVVVPEVDSINVEGGDTLSTFAAKITKLSETYFPELSVAVTVMVEFDNKFALATR